MGKYEIIACTIDSIILALLPPPARVVRLAIYCSERGVRDDKGNLIGVPIDDWSTHPDYTRIRDSFAKQFPNDRLIMQQFVPEQPGLGSNSLNVMEIGSFLNGDLNIIFSHTGQRMPYISNIVKTEAGFDIHKLYLENLNTMVSHKTVVFACHLSLYFNENRNAFSNLTVDEACIKDVSLDTVFNFIKKTLPELKK